METDRIEPFFNILKQVNIQCVLAYTKEEFAEARAEFEQALHQPLANAWTAVRREQQAVLRHPQHERLVDARHGSQRVMARGRKLSLHESGKFGRCAAHVQHRECRLAGRRAPGGVHRAPRAHAYSSAGSSSSTPSEA